MTAKRIEPEYRSEELQDVSRRIAELSLSKPVPSDVFTELPEIRRIALATDGSPGAEPAMTWTAALARAFSAKVTAISVAPADVAVPSWIGLGASQSQRKANEAFAARAEETLNAIPDARALKGLDVKTWFDRGSPTRRIAAACKKTKSDLVILGARGHVGRERFTLGSVAHGVLHHAPCAVLIARSAPPPRRIVVGADGSRPSLRAVRVALRIGGVLGAKVTVLHAHDTATYGPDWGDSEADPVLAALNEKFPLELMNGRLRLQVSHGRPAQALMDAADAAKAGLIVVGSHGRGGIGSHILGSVSSRVGLDAGQSVLVTRGL